MSEEHFYQQRLNGALLVSAEKSLQIAEAAKQQQIQTLTNAQKDSEIRRLQEEVARLRRNQTEQAPTESQDKVKSLAAKNQVLETKVDKLMASLAERDEIIVDWMHNNEAFKRLARQYGKELNKTNEQRQSDLDQHVLDIAEEQPERFGNTKPLRETKKALGL